MEHRITATDLARRLGDVLARVRYRGDTFVIERNGDAVARVTPVPEGSPTTAIIDAGPGATSITVIARQEAEYLGQIPHHREPILVDTWVGHLGGASMHVCYEVLSPDRTELYARAATIVVMLDASTGAPRSCCSRRTW